MLMKLLCLCQGLDSAWRSSTPGSALGTLLRSPEPPGDPLQEPGSDFRSALQCASLPCTWGQHHRILALQWSACHAAGIQVLLGLSDGQARMCGHVCAQRSMRIPAEHGLARGPHLVYDGRTYRSSAFTSRLIRCVWESSARVLS